MRSSKPTLVIRVPPWAWRLSPTACGRNSCGYDPEDPIWPNRDRFVLSAGHASMLLVCNSLPDRRAQREFQTTR